LSLLYSPLLNLYYYEFHKVVGNARCVGNADVSVTALMCRWRAGRLAGDGGRGPSGRGRRWAVQVRLFTGRLGVVTAITAASTAGRS